MLLHLQSQNLGWAKKTMEKLSEYGLVTDWEAIKTQTKGQWKNVVGKAVDEFNKKKMIENCLATTAGETRVKTKTKHIHQQLTNSSIYDRKPVNIVINGNKERAKTLILARHGMLECGVNFKGTMAQKCHPCGTDDDENHRLNTCVKYNDTEGEPVVLTGSRHNIC